MSTPARSIARTPLVVTFAWLLILAKCILVTWAVQHWQVPIHPGWIVWPTVAFGALATCLWLGGRNTMQ